MSMNDDVDAVTAAPQPGAMPQFVSPIVPKGTIAGRALVAIVAIMTLRRPILSATQPQMIEPNGALIPADSSIAADWP